MINNIPEMTSQNSGNIFETVTALRTEAIEQVDKFIFNTVDEYLQQTYSMEITKNELAEAIAYIRTRREIIAKGSYIGYTESLNTATEMKEMTDRSYHAGFNAGMQHVIDKFNNMVEGSAE